jgi:hypothetical protein
VCWRRLYRGHTYIPWFHQRVSDALVASGVSRIVVRHVHGSLVGARDDNETAVLRGNGVQGPGDVHAAGVQPSVLLPVLRIVAGRRDERVAVQRLPSAVTCIRACVKTKQRVRFKVRLRRVRMGANECSPPAPRHDAAASIDLETGAFKPQ